MLFNSYGAKSSTISKPSVWLSIITYSGVGSSDGPLFTTDLETFTMFTSGLNASAYSLIGSVTFLIINAWKPLH